MSFIWHVVSFATVWGFAVLFQAHFSSFSYELHYRTSDRCLLHLLREWLLNLYSSEFSPYFNTKCLEHPFNFILMCFVVILCHRGICNSNQFIKRTISQLFPHLAEAYSNIYKEQRNCENLKKSKKEEFFGLRDYYR